MIIFKYGNFSCKIIESKMRLFRCVWLSVLVEFLFLLIRSRNDGNSFVHWALLCGFQTSDYAFEITAPRRSLQIIFNIVFIDAVNGLLLFLFTGHIISSSSTSTMLSLMTWKSEHKHRISMHAHWESPAICLLSVTRDGSSGSLCIIMSLLWKRSFSKIWSKAKLGMA